MRRIKGNRLFWLILLCLTPGVLGAQDTNVLLLEPQLLGGAAFGDFPESGEMLGAFGIELRLERGALELSGLYRRFGVARACEDSDPPVCNVEIPSGQFFSLQAGRVLRTTRTTQVSAGFGAGIGRILDNAERHSGTHGVLSSYIDVDVMLADLRLALGTGLDYVKSVPLVTMKVGLAWVL